MNRFDLQTMAEERVADRLFAKNWGIVKDWSETSRNDAAITPAQASLFFIAVTDESNGVLSWLKRQW